MGSLSDLLLLLLFQTTVSSTCFATAVACGGRWDLLQASIGVSAMHMQLLFNDRVVIFDRTDFGASNLSLPEGRCRDDPNDKALKHDCTAHSAEYDVAANAFRPLTVLTDTWCSSGTVAPDGSLVQTGGFNDGERAVRVFCPCGGDGSACDWNEVSPRGLAARRWYATNQVLPDGRAFIAGGRRQFNYEFYPKSDTDTDTDTINLPFLRQTFDPEENNLYPFVHLNVDGNLFIFANNRAILFDYNKNAVVRSYPTMPGGDPRNYPSTGSSVLLPLNASRVSEAEVLVCGGAPKGSYNVASTNGTFVGALDTCGRIKITDESPSWSMETMPTRRVMGDMVMLPNGKVLIVNGAAAGTAGWELGRDPVLSPVIYSPDAAPGARFDVQAPATTPRLYHSSAILLRDGRVLVGGSNPHAYYNFSGVRYPTDLSLESYSPDYLNSSSANFRPKIVAPTSPAEVYYGKQFAVQFSVASSSTDVFYVTMVAPSFTTHSFAMNQRLVIVDISNVTKSYSSTTTTTTYSALAMSPASGNYAPPGYYMLFVVNAGVPSEGIWVHIQ